MAYTKTELAKIAIQERRRVKRIFREALLIEVEMWPQLYVLRHPDYKDDELKTRIYDSIGKKLGVTGKF